jgi:phosphohistidine phosphatase
MAVTLVVIRHAKSDWSVPAADRDRPLATRGRKQAPATGRWVSANCPDLDLAVVSAAARTRQTWTLVAEELGDDVDLRESEDAYTFDGRDLVEVVRHLPTSAHCVALVSHNPAVEELVEALTEEWVPMPTSALAVVELEEWSSAGEEPGRLLAAGRPADDQWFVRAATL